MTYPSNEVKDLYVRLHANVNGMELGSCYSNVIKIQVIATYQAPSIKLPENILLPAQVSVNLGKLGSLLSEFMVLKVTTLLWYISLMAVHLSGVLMLNNG